MEKHFEHLGGDAGIERLVTSLYQRILSDDRLAPFFDGVDMNLQRRKFRSFLHTVSGGPQSRTSIELRSAHSQAVDRGLEDSHVDLFVGHFQQTLDDADVPTHIVDDVMVEIARTREDVLGL